RAVSSSVVSRQPPCGAGQNIRPHLARIYSGSSADLSRTTRRQLLARRLGSAHARFLASTATSGNPISLYDSQLPSRMKNPSHPDNCSADGTPGPWETLTQVVFPAANLDFFDFLRQAAQLSG